MATPVSITSCSGEKNACVANCIADSTCPAITYITLNRTTDPNEEVLPGANEFGYCLRPCTML